MLASSLLHYRILEKIGAGAMGEVYKAEDTRLERRVALKIMAPALGRDAVAKRRFMQEARAASALDHPNICTIHDILETEDGQLFLVMAFYEGETLATRLRRGRLGFAEAETIIRQLAAALARAHDYGIIHRDIKPANVIITRHGELKLLDFGLAKLKDDAAMTSPGVAMGTPYYMSPEQITGGPIDHRCDIWALGVLCYEALLGQRPFPGASVETVLHAIVYEEFTAVGLLRDDTPPTLQAVVEGALTKSPDERFRDCHEILRLLDRQPPAARRALQTERLVPHHAILVLPFVNLAGGRSGEPLAYGVTDAVTTTLARLAALRVFARTAADRVNTSKRSPREAARELAADYLVTGAVRRQGKQLSVSTNVTDVRSGVLVWAGQFKGTVEQIFEIEERLARKLVEAFRLTLTQRDEDRLRQPPLADVVAYECYLKAKQEFVRYSQHSLHRALEYIETARARVGDNILLLAAAGHIHWQLVNAGVSLDRSNLDKAKEAAERIRQLDPDSPHGYRLLGMVAMLEGDIYKGIGLLETAAAGDPHDTDTLSILGPSYGFIGRPHIGMPWVEKLLEIDPLTPMYQALPGILLLMEGAFDEATGPLATSWKLDPANPIVALCYGQSLALNSMNDLATTVFDDLWRLAQGSVLAQLGQAYKHALNENPAGVAGCITTEVISVAEGDPYHAWNVAECYALIDNADQALHWLDRAVSRGFVNYPLIAELDPFLASVRRDPRFASLRQSVKGKWEQGEVRKASGSRKRPGSSSKAANT